ncbi:Dipeptide transport system permease protein DppB [Polystyrenella longa]|uniref:Dipeptide transport system permease protein DppB n=1 Tax=Polystyrenella longa TaxID=2528007 RepID=A0A518CS14_9PLAN|nr:ABC transporter permease [Polystyrenella longa]QDU81994.1 Dipeptide transport system permease protein DppB [Polystyrenella longa]
MYSYIIRRSLIGLVTLLIITFIVFGLIRNIPGTPFTMAQAELLDPSKTLGTADVNRLKEAYGLDKPWYESYAYWIWNLAQGDLGNSFDEKIPVTEVIANRFVPTLIVSLSSLFFTYILAIPIGLYSTVYYETVHERSVSILLYALYSFPVMVAALMLQFYFAYRLDWLPLTGMRTTQGFDDLSTFGQTWDITKHAILPVICSSYGGLAYLSRFVNSNMQEVIRLDFIRTARAKGVGPRDVIINHAFRNTLIPLITIFGLTLPGLLSGSIIIEGIFQWPGMGQLFFESIPERDYPVIMGLTLMFSVLTLLGQLLADVLYAFADPRVRLS